MHNDDETVGRILTRRELVQLLGAGSAAVVLAGVNAGTRLHAAGLQASSSPACVVQPEQTEGPYFVDDQLVRSDIRVEPSTGVAKEGVVLALAVTVFDVSNGQCRPLPGAVVDIWQCDAQGVYSGATDRGFNTVGQKFLRGLQTTGEQGRVQFLTVHPGWYSGRTVHIHFKVRTEAGGNPWEFTSQWYFDEEVNSRILAEPAYRRPGQRDTLNAEDGIFRNGGDQLLLHPVPDGPGSAASFAIGLDLTDRATGRPDGGGGRRGRGA